MSVHQVYGDLLTIYHVDAICHQVNCLTVRSHGLSRQIALKYPWADIYQKRRPVAKRNLATLETRGVPGTLRIFSKSGCPAIVCFLSQWDFGRCQNIRQRKISPYVDTKENRETWFRQCLQELAQTPFQTVAFPFKMGCGLAGGDWSFYFGLIKIFAKTSGKKIIIAVPRDWLSFYFLLNTQMKWFFKKKMYGFNYMWAE